MKRPGLASALLLLVGLAEPPCSPRLASAVPHDPRAVVSYLVSAVSDTTNWVPDEPYLFGVPRHGWHWRIFDPASRRDSLFLELASFPLLMQWDSLFTSVEFISGNRIVRVPWRLGEIPRTLATLPVDSAFCDFWLDPDGGWHLVTQTMVSFDPGRAPVPVAARWDQSRSGGWQRAVVDSPVLDSYGVGYDSPKLHEGTSRIKAITVSSLLDSMRIGNYRDFPFGQDDPRTWVPSALDSTVGLEMWTGFGDTYHAMEPVTWVDRVHGLRKEVYAKGQSQDNMSSQLAFAERGRSLLIVAEFSGAYPAVIDMRSGSTLLKLDRLSARAVWVPAPAGWPR